MKVENILREHSKKVTPERVQLFEYMEKEHLFTASDVVTCFPSI